MPKKNAARLEREIAASLRTPSHLRAEVDRRMQEATDARRRLDQIEPPTPGRVFRRVDSLLSMAQDQIGRHVTTMEVKVRAPGANQAGHEIFDAIEAVRRRILKLRLP